MSKGFITRKMVQKGDIVTGPPTTYQSLNDYINAIVVDIYNRFFDPNGFSKFTGFNVKGTAANKTKLFYYIMRGISTSINAYLSNLKQQQNQ